ncbi:MAG: acyl-CoA thioesterase [Gemmatimonadota bacterium]
MANWSKTFEVRWADLDSNQHMRHTAYADYGTHVRMSYLASRGFDQGRMVQLGFGAVILREENLYLKEVGAGDVLTYDLQLAGVSPEGTRFRLRHEARRGDGRTAVRITVEGGWLDLKERRLRPPPAGLREALADLPRSADFEELPEQGRRRS